MSGGNDLLVPPSNGNGNGIDSGDGDCNGDDPDHLHRSHLGHDNRAIESIENYYE